MSYPYGQQQPPAYGAQNLNFYQSSYSQQPVSGHSTPFQAYSGGASSNAYPQQFGSAGFGGPGYGAPPGLSGQMGTSGGLRTGWLAAFGTEGYEGEPPLLDELGVNFDHIKTKTFTVLNPLARIDSHLMDDSDLAGPILFFLLMGFSLLASGKVHFGYIYGVAALGSILLHLILSLMSPAIPGSTDPSASHDKPPTGGHFSSSLTYPRSLSVLGYCLLPLVLVSALGIALPMDSFFGYIFTSAAIAWCTYSSSAIFCSVGRMTDMRLLVAYPLALFYVCFGIMAIFSSRGTGSLEAKVGG